MSTAKAQERISAAVEKATEVLERERVISLSSNDAKTIFALMDAPPAPSDALKGAVRSRKGLLCSR